MTITKDGKDVSPKVLTASGLVAITIVIRGGIKAEGTIIHHNVG
jgi:hypothetical protein